MPWWFGSIVFDLDSLFGRLGLLLPSIDLVAEARYLDAGVNPLFSSRSDSNST